MATITPKRLSALLFVLLALILLPAFLYTGYEISRLNVSEEELTSVYGRQLDAVLFSVNQYAWDITGGWVNILSSSTAPSVVSGFGSAPRSTSPRTDRNLPDVLAHQPSIRLAAIIDTQLAFRRTMYRAQDDSIPMIIAQLRDSLSVHRETLSRLLRYQATGYRKSEPLLLRRNGAPAILALLAPIADADDENVFSLLCIDSDVFVATVLSEKLKEIAGSEFILTCSESTTGRVITTTAPVDKVSHVYQRRSLWLFPDFIIGIRLRGKTVQELARERFVSTGLLFAAVDLLLVLGVWFVYRNLKRELQLAEMKTDFVSNVSHELKTPLALIRMYAETLEMGRIADPEKQHEYHSIIVQETERLTRLINNILTFSRIESGKKTYTKIRTDLNAVVSDVMGVYRYHLEQKGFTTAVDLREGLPLLEADEEAVAEAILNLLDNAMKYSPDIKDIAVRTSCDERSVWIEVEDHGMGIALPQQKKIFEKFYRVSEGLVHTAKGSGLGLALVEHIMHAHGGHIDLRSVPGEGSRFRLVFPLSSNNEGPSHGTHSRH
ncbi:MAG: HAMP domain-containing histidine kinase [Bacteroidetes bacterium]|nr:HAMP domain-containing histidine kinase [Bacteroidota bacterium]